MQPKIDKITINLDTKLSSKFVSWAEIKKFFPHKEVRDGQKQVIRVLVTVLKKVKYKHKYDDIIVCAPTGLGKSSIVVTVANFFAKQGLKSSILMQRKGLIDQYAISYDIPIMKGRNNYECIHDRDLCKRCGLCDDSNCSADVAPCVTIEGFECSHQIKRKKGSDGKYRVLSTSRGRLYSDAFLCDYWQAKVDTLDSNVSIISSMYAIKEQSCIDDYGTRELLFYDEANSIVDDIAMIVATRVYASQMMRFCKIKKEFPNYKFSKDWLPDLKELIIMANHKIRKLERKKEELYKYIDWSNDIDKRKTLEINVNKICKSITIIKHQIEHFEETINRIENNWKNWRCYYGIEKKKDGSTDAYVEFKPVYIEHIAQQKLNKLGTKRIYVSATIPSPEVFCKELGIRNALFINVPQSPFPVENRRIFYTPVGKMGIKDKEITTPKIIKVIEQILSNQFNTVKGLIIPFSHELRKKIYEGLSDNTKKRIIMTTTEQDANKREQIIKEFIKTKEPKILMSTYIIQGFDGKDDIARFIIIPKTMYPSLGDEIVHIKFTDSQEWYQSVTCQNMMQACGRATRSANDWSTIIILDANFGRLYQNKKLFPEWFKEAIITKPFDEIGNIKLIQPPFPKKKEIAL